MGAGSVLLAIAICVAARGGPFCFVLLIFGAMASRPKILPRWCDLFEIISMRYMCYMRCSHQLNCLSFHCGNALIKAHARVHAY